MLQPVDCFPLPDAIFTDGSLCAAGGAAAVQPDTGTEVLVSVPNTRSSTHCELVALRVATALHPPQILTDSLSALHLVRGWGCKPIAKVLQCADRVEVRQLITTAMASGHPPLMEKVKAHDQQAIDIGHPKAVGNDLADSCAGCAATGLFLPWLPDSQLFGGPV